MIFTLLAVATLTTTTTTVNAAATIDWSTLPWNDLSTQLSESAALITSKEEAQAATYNAQCVPEMQKAISERTMHNLINQPGGVCMNQLACGFHECNPLNPETYTDITVEERLDLLVNSLDGLAIDYLFGDFSVANLPKNQSIVDGWLEAGNPSWNLPTTVLFPVTAGDIVAAIKFAKLHGLEVSVKNSGHSYTGASMKKDTLHVNMNNYTRYADTGTAIVDCNETIDEDAAFQSDLSDQPCRFSKARGKNGAIRVGGGENFDKMYRAVKSFNENIKNETGSYKYYNAGGGAGTVSPMGWTFQGGLAWATNSRRIGLGVDQVIQVDMVLPNGEHVRFGPTAWEEQDENYIYPKTTEVTGVCHQNPQEVDESKWVWSTCEEEINFVDLWFALRGGGGGTWGIVTSMIIQLHDYLPLELGGSQLLSCIPAEATQIYKPYFDRFFSAFLSNPFSIGVTNDEASQCGAFGLGDSSNQLFCYGENSSKPFISAWSTYVSSINKTLADAGLNASTINDLALSCGNEVAMPLVDYAGIVLIPDGPNKGKVTDGPPPSYLSTTENVVNMIVPAKYFADNPNASDTFQLFYGAFGANVPYATDQENALSEAHRLGGYMVALAHDFFDETFYTDVFPQMFDTTDPENFPGFVGSNHAGPNTRGPLKEDWTKPCPLDWTTAERDEKCISLQEAIWGTKTLARLEKIKREVDPNYMFDCYGCVGNNRVKAVNTGIATEAEQEDSAAERGITIEAEEEDDSAEGTGITTEDEEDNDSSDAFIPYTKVVFSVLFSVVWHVAGSI